MLLQPLWIWTASVTAPVGVLLKLLEEEKEEEEEDLLVVSGASWPELLRQATQASPRSPKLRAVAP